MGDIAYAAQIAQQGLRDLSGGLSAVGQKKQLGKLGEQYKQQNPDPDGQFIGESLRRGQLSPEQAMGLKDRSKRRDPMESLGYFLEMSLDPNTPDDQRMVYKDAFHKAATVMQMLSAAKRGGSDGGGSGEKILKLDESFTMAVDQMFADAMAKGMPKTEATIKKVKFLGAFKASGGGVEGYKSTNVEETVGDVFQDLSKYLDFKQPSGDDGQEPTEDLRQQQDTTWTIPD